MNEDMKFPRPSVEKLNEYHELCQKMHDAQLTDEQLDELMAQLNDIIGAYDLDNYVFQDDATGEFVPIELYEEDEKYDNTYVYNTHVNI